MIGRFIVTLTLTLLPLQAMACPDWLGWAVLHAAWPTPEYKKCTWQIDQRQSGGRIINIKSFAESRISLLDDKEVWIQALIEIDRYNNVSDVHWGSYKAMFPPNQGYELIVKALAESR